MLNEDASKRKSTKALLRCRFLKLPSLKARVLLVQMFKTITQGESFSDN
jgi:hypothetical protein